MRGVLREAIAYRIGSTLLSLVVVWLVTGEAALSLALMALLSVTHTLYHMAFVHYWRKRN